MTGSILQAARADAIKYVTDAGFQVDITLQTPSGDMTLDIQGIASSHNLSFDTDGLPVKGKNIHVTLVENDLSEAQYPYLTASNEIDLRDHLVSFKDSSGVVATLVVKSDMANRNLGLIPLTLGEWQ